MDDIREHRPQEIIEQSAGLEILVRVRHDIMRMSPRATIDETAHLEFGERRQRSGIRALDGAETAQRTP
eukprot:4740581-Alexandrium_andersonii.AAC.1